MLSTARQLALIRRRQSAGTPVLTAWINRSCRMPVGEPKRCWICRKEFVVLLKFSFSTPTLKLRVEKRWGSKMSSPLHWPLLFGALPTVLLVVGAAGAGFLLVRPRRGWVTRVLPAVLVGSVASTVVIAWVVNDLWVPFPDPLPVSVLAWIGVILVGVALAVAHFFSASGWHKVIAVVASVAVLAAGANEINAVYGYYPTVAALLRLPLPQERPLPPIQRAIPHLGGGKQSGPVLRGWHPALGMPASGTVSQIPIPGVRSGFPARPAWIYLPPAYLAPNRPELPVLVLSVGQPGTTRDWIDAGRVITVMDAFAAAHSGLAPIVVMPDPLGSTMANPLCANTSLGNADTYLAGDVPAWISANLQVDRDTRHWAVGGFSYGGTCALQLAVNHPKLYPSFLDISGQNAPTLGSRHRTLDRAFGGDPLAFAKINPVDILAAAHRTSAGRLPIHTPFSRVAGTLVVGSSDPTIAAQQREVQAAAVGAGISIRWLEEPGGHHWPVATAGLEQSLPWLAHRMGLI